LTHQRFGWWSLLVFAALGLSLELLHGFKIQLYLSVSNETRRLMWTLAHAHGVLLAVINIVFGLTVSSGRLPIGSVARNSTALIAASILLPGGFFAAGIRFYEADPGLGIIGVPVGAALLLVVLFSIARAVRGAD
jgi:ABC-type cobalamin transport system permease subunit